MKKERGKCEIYRKKGGINLNDFRSKVREAMNSEGNYHFCKNNCIHFALFLLGLADFYMELVSMELGLPAAVGWPLHPQPTLLLHADPIPPWAGPWVVGTAVGTAKPPAHEQLSLAGGRRK